jgi:hypothetical protein
MSWDEAIVAQHEPLPRLRLLQSMHHSRRYRRGVGGRGALISLLIETTFIATFTQRFFAR